AARSALVNASKPRLRQMQEAGVGGAGLAARVAEDSTPLIATVRLGQTLCRFFAAGLTAWLLTPALAGVLRQWPSLAVQAEAEAFFVVVLLTALAVMSVGELLPEAWALRAPEQAAIFFAPFVAALEWLLKPLVRWMLWLSAWIAEPLAGRRVPFVTEEEIKTLVDAGEEGGVLEEEEKEMIYSIFEIGETMAREIMVPRMDVLALDVDTPLPEATEAVLSAGHSRVPVYQGSTDNIIGLLYAKDLLRVRKDQTEGLSLRDLLRPAYFVPETKKVDELLAELQQKRIHLAVVVDEYGGTAGIVTLEDIVEEIVGEIRDEYDVNEESLFERVSETEYIFDARIDIDEVNELLAVQLPSADSDSLGGFIYGQLGHVPAPSEKVTAGEVQFEVLTVTGRRIRKVRATRVTPPVGAAETPAADEESLTHD
ncbi:MAG: hemolysin family protein, partial [Anaerolineales bacterium]